MEKLGDVIAVVRSFNEPSIGSFVRSLLGFLPSVVIVVIADLDRGLTRKTIESECVTLINRIHIVETEVKHGTRSWSELLNVGIFYVKDLVTSGHNFKYLFNVSNTTSFTKSDVRDMLRVFEYTPKAGIVGTTFRGIDQNGKYVELGTTYNKTSRNTGMIIRMELFDHPALSGFDLAYDGQGAMEDYAFIATAKHFGWTNFIVDLQVPLLVGRHWNQEEKRKFMEAGIETVDKRLKSLGYEK